MPVRSKTRNRQGRIDPSLPKNPPTVNVTVDIVDGTIVLAADEPLQYNAKLADTGAGDACPGITVDNVDGGHNIGTVTLTEGNTVATLHVDGGTVANTGVTVNLSPQTQALRSVRGGILAIGQITF